MTLYVYRCILFVVLMVKIVRCRDCNQFYQIFQENNYARIAVPMPENHNNHIKLNVQLQCVNADFSREDWNGKLQFVGTPQDVLQNLPLVFTLKYVVPYSILPKIISISINNNDLCVSEQSTEGFTRISNVNLAVTIQISTSDNRDNKLTTTLRPLPLSYTKPPPIANPYYQKATNGIIERNQMPQNNNNRKVSQSLPSACGRTSKMSGLHLIANGKDAQVKDHPWIGAMFHRKKEESNKPIFLCGASLITNKHAITAGHCVVPHINSEIFVIFGRTLVNDWLDENSQRVKVAKAETHPDYSIDTADADISILHFSKEITFTATVQPVCLWDTSSLSEDIVDKTGVVVGWGKDEHYQFPQHLQELYLYVASEEQCLRAASNGEFFNITSNRTICAGNRDGSGPCQGDSGSGFYFNVHNRWYIRGIVSHSLNDFSGRCDFSQYAVFLDVAKHMQWIRRLI